MKKLLALLFLCTLVFGADYKEFAKEMGYETDYKTALKRAKKEEKNLMILMVTNYCPWCTKFENRTLSNGEIDALIKSKYIPLIINKEEKNFPSYLNAPVVPTTYFVSAKEEKSFYESVGFSNKVDFLHLLKQLD